MVTRSGAAAYQKTGQQSGVLDADPHRLIQLLYQGALDNLAKARGFMERKDFEAKGQVINKAIEIIGSLQGVLDHEQGGEIAANLDRLYTYMLERIFEASRSNQVEIVDEVTAILREIKSGWDEIREQYVTTSMTDVPDSASSAVDG